MKVSERIIEIPLPENDGNLLTYLEGILAKELSENEIPIRFAITESTKKIFKCALGLITISDNHRPDIQNLFKFRLRSFERGKDFNVAMIVPTGIGAEIGGHAGDATPAARLLAESCDKLILHPNVVNASDINEMPQNCLYVEGSVLSRLLMGTVSLDEVRSNNILVLIDEHKDSYFTDAAINSVIAANASAGITCKPLKIGDALKMSAYYSSSGTASGEVEGIDKLLSIISSEIDSFDAVAICSIIDLPNIKLTDYFSKEIVNPLGGVEALLTHTFSSLLNLPSAHSPMMEDRETMNEELGIVDPRKAAEAVSLTFLHCILKGLSVSPRIVTDPSLLIHDRFLSVEDISCIVIPDGCLGLPTLAALSQGIKVIAVRENRNLMKNDLSKLQWASDQFYMAENYWEVSGILNSIKGGIDPKTVRRPLHSVDVRTVGTKKSTTANSINERVKEKPSS